MSFSRRIASLSSEYKKRMTNVLKDSAKEVADTANTPQAKGGRMPVDTGALRASIRAAVGSMPSGESEQVDVGIAMWNPGDTLYIGWLMNYARFMEYRYGYVRGAAEKWPDIVRRNASKVKR